MPDVLDRDADLTTIHVVLPVREEPPRPAPESAVDSELGQLLARRPVLVVRAHAGDRAAANELRALDSRVAALGDLLAALLHQQEQRDQAAAQRRQQAARDEVQLRARLAECHDRVEAALADLVEVLAVERDVLLGLDNALARQGRQPMTMPSEASWNAVRARLSAQLGTVPALRGFMVTGASAPALTEER